MVPPLSRRDALKALGIAGAAALQPPGPVNTGAHAAGPILPLTSTSDVHVPPRGRSFVKFSFDHPEPSVPFEGFSFGLMVFTRENAYGLDQARMSVHETDGGLEDGGVANCDPWCYRGGGGAGGRIAVEADNLAPTIQFSPQGASGNQPGGEGTVYFGIVDPSLSTFTIAPNNGVVANGTDLVTVSVTLKNAAGMPVSNKPVDIAITSGSNLYIKNQLGSYQYVGMNQYIRMGTTNANGIVTTTLKSFTTGVRTISIHFANQTIISQDNIVEFLPGPVSANMLDLSPATANAAAFHTLPIGFPNLRKN